MIGELDKNRFICFGLFISFKKQHEKKTELDFGTSYFEGLEATSLDFLALSTHAEAVPEAVFLKEMLTGIFVGSGFQNTAQIIRLNPEMA